MKVVDKGYTYKVDNVTRGRQTVKFHKGGIVNDTTHEGTNLKELLEVCLDKVNFEHELADDSSTQAKYASIKGSLKGILRELLN